MNFTKLEEVEIDKLIDLLNKYKIEIGEITFKEDEVLRLKHAVKNNDIEFYIAVENETIIASCSLTKCFSTYNCSQMAIFEDFYIEKVYRGKGIAQQLVTFATNCVRDTGVKSIWVGCCDEDKAMYKKLGFDIELGNLLTFN